MPIIDYLERNAREFGADVALVEINPDVTETRRVTWREYELIEANPTCQYRREITWNVFNEKANRFANLLVSRGIQKGDKIGILMMNCLEWLPIYFGALKTGALAVPLNFRYDSQKKSSIAWSLQTSMFWYSDRNLSDVLKPLWMKLQKRESCFMSAAIARRLQRIMIN